MRRKSAGICEDSSTRTFHLRESRANRFISTRPVGTSERKKASSIQTPLRSSFGFSYTERWVSHAARFSISTPSASASVQCSRPTLSFGSVSPAIDSTVSRSSRVSE